MRYDKNQDNVFEHSHKERFVVPPGLINKMFEFHALIETSQTKPILITGPTGVGKSLFIDMYCEWYKHKYGKESKIITLNCSHFEKGFARSELFGHVKGAFTGAIKENEGWIKKAEGGLLILDEIGELPDECQAQLLTFMEDHKYHKVGENKIIEVRDLNIVGATNREWEKPGMQLRYDLLNRFITFNIPPLHKRRGDVLYYIAAKDPEIINSLYMSDVLALLSYNWPGNVREIERLISLFKQRNYLRKINPIIRWSDLEDNKKSEVLDYSEEIFPGFTYSDLECELSDLSYLDDGYTNFSLSLSSFLYDDLSDNGVDVEDLELLLNHNGIGLCPEDTLKAFQNFTTDSINRVAEVESTKSFEELASMTFNPLRHDGMLDSEIKSLENQILEAYQTLFNVKILSEYQPFPFAMNGYNFFCSLFLQNAETNRNVLVEVKKRNISVHPTTSFVFHRVNDTPELVTEERVTKQAFDFMKGIRNPVLYNGEKQAFINHLKKHYHFDDKDLYSTIQIEESKLKSGGDLDLSIQIEENKLEKESKEKNEIDIFMMSEKEFEKYYYEGLLMRYETGRKIAQILKIKEQTIYSRLKAKRKAGIISFEDEKL